MRSWMKDSKSFYKKDWLMKHQLWPETSHKQWFSHTVFCSFSLFPAQLFAYRLTTLSHILSWYRNAKFLSAILVRNILTPILLTWRIWWTPNNASKWQMGFSWVFNGLIGNWRLLASWLLSSLQYFKISVMNEKWIENKQQRIDSFLRIFQ